jgi:tetratricopeptide (TPR) repeat protein
MRQNKIILAFIGCCCLFLFIGVVAGESADYWYQKGLILSSQGKYSEAVQAFDHALQLNPDNPDYWNDKGLALASSKHWNEALVAFDTALSKDPNYIYGHLNKCYAYNSLNRYSDALIECNASIAIYPHEASAWNNLGQAYQGLGNDEEAINAYNRSLEINPYFITAWGNKGEALLKQGKKDDAINVLKKGLAIDPNDPWIQALIDEAINGTVLDKSSVKNSSIQFHNISSITPQQDNTFPFLFPFVFITFVVVIIGGAIGYIKYRRKIAKSIPPPLSFTPKPVTPKQPPTELSERYTDWEFIGKGGFAQVFKAKRKDGQYVAVKIPISFDESTGKSFIAELQNWTRLNHPNIVKVYNFNILPNPYFEMELCDSSLAEVHKPIETEEATWLIFNVCEGLKFTHTQKIIHRDLKPQNILLKNGVPKISDWGLSRVITASTSTTGASFTPNYAAPEQIGNKSKDERTDIWQLGVIFYELVTGTLPFKGETFIEVMEGIATKNPQLPSAINPSSHDIEAVIMKCLDKKPDRRYQSVLELQKDLALYLRVTYTELLKESVSIQDYNRSAYYCGDLVMVNLLTGDIQSAYKYLLDLVHYSKGDVRSEAQDLSEQIKLRIEMGIGEIPDELITKAEVIVHKVNLHFSK